MFAKKSLGQNFIHDVNFLKKLSSKIITNSKTKLIEIGPGKGALTKYLLKKKHNEIILIEKDNILIENLRFLSASNPKVTVKHLDALDFDLSDLKIKSNSIIVGNLPFNISSQLLIKWITIKEWPPFYEKMYLMFQKELGERIIAKHNTKSYGKISVIAQYRCHIKKLFKAPSDIFIPKPKVEGIVLEFTPHNNFKNVNFNKLNLLLKNAFQQRRKKIKSSLKMYSNHLIQRNLNLDLRAENLSVKEFCEIAKLI